MVGGGGAAEGGGEQSGAAQAGRQSCKQAAAPRAGAGEAGAGEGAYLGTCTGGREKGGEEGDLGKERSKGSLPIYGRCSQLVLKNYLALLLTS